jgi:hypothetical protein
MSGFVRAYGKLKEIDTHTVEFDPVFGSKFTLNLADNFVGPIPSPEEFVNIEYMPGTPHLLIRVLSDTNQSSSTSEVTSTISSERYPTPGDGLHFVWPGLCMKCGGDFKLKMMSDTWKLTLNPEDETDVSISILSSVSKALMKPSQFFFRMAGSLIGDLKEGEIYEIRFPITWYLCTQCNIGRVSFYNLMEITLKPGTPGHLIVNMKFTNETYDNLFQELNTKEIEIQITEKDYLK